MALKIVAALAFCAVASAGYVQVTPVYHHAAPVVAHAPLAVAHKVHTHGEDYDDHPKYNFEYGVEDKVTGDIKSQSEQRDGDVVHGEYSLIDADGYKRTVHYTADDRNGFQAEVHREPLNHVVKTVAAPTHYVQPTVVKTVQPVHHVQGHQAHHYAAPTVVKSHDAPYYAHYNSPAAQYSTHHNPSVIYHH